MINAAHGGNDLGLDIRLDLSANLNPMGMPESVRAAAVASAGSWESYPDPMCRVLREKLAEKLGEDMENIVCGNGADDLIYRIASALKPQRALICAPTFAEYGKALRENGCEVREHILRERRLMSYGAYPRGIVWGGHGDNLHSKQSHGNDCAP